MSAVRGVLFDLDGVLVDTDRLHFRAWGELAARLGLPFTREQGDRCRGISRMASLEIVLEGARRAYTPEEKEALALEKNLRYRQLLSALTPADTAEGARAVMEELRRRGYRLALASASRNAEEILRRTRLGELLDGVADGCLVTSSKPDPQVFLTAARLIGLPPEACAAVDDALAGIEAARRAGALPIAMGDAARHGAGAHNITRLEQLLELLPDRRNEA